MKKSYIFASVTVLIWATLAPVAKLLLTDIPSFETLAISSAFAFVFLLIVNIISGSIKLMKTYRFTDYLIMAGLGFVGLFMYSALYYFGINQLSSQEACILNYLWPIMIVLFASIVLKEKLTVRKIIAMLLSFTGIAVISLGNTDAGNGSRILGIAACVGAAVCYGLFSVLNKKRGYNQSVTMMIIWLTTAICSFVSGLFVESFKPIEELQWLGMIWLGVVINAVAYLLWAIALKGAKDSAKIANLAYLVPFLSIVISAVVLQEQITVNALLALLLIVGGILLQSINIKRRS
ncbi:MAG: DMT family transporter [Ruminococcus sp.]|nr:DMT family transporter [Ruminococcus sp.]